MRTLSTCVVLGFVCCVLGCASRTTQIESPKGDPPSYASLRDQHNERVQGLDRVWARAVVALRFVDDQGRQRREQGEGHLQHKRPGDLALTVGKLGETYFHAGSNGDRYWWIDLSGDEKSAWIGARENADRFSAQRFGVPVQPTQLVDLAAMTLWPEAASGPTRWSMAVPGSVRFEFVRDGGTIVVHADPGDGTASRIEMLTAEGDIAAWSELDEYAAVPVRGGGRLPSRIPTKLSLVSPGTDSSVDIWLSQPRIDQNKPRDNAVVFDIDRLIDIYRVSRVTNIDDQDESR